MPNMLNDLIVIMGGVGERLVEMSYNECHCRKGGERL